MMMASEQPGSGAAQRRRQRRVRSWLRHERMTVAMALAESTHHSSRGQTIARAGVWGHELNYTATVRNPPPPPAGALHPLRRRALQVAATDRMPTLSGPQSAGSAAHCGPDCRRRSWVADARCSCAADSGTAGGCAPVRRCACACCRAGY